jgi:hypothetical protein
MSSRLLTEAMHFSVQTIYEAWSAAQSLNLGKNITLQIHGTLLSQNGVWATLDFVPVTSFQKAETNREEVRRARKGTTELVMRVQFTGDDGQPFEVWCVVADHVQIRIWLD